MDSDYLTSSALLPSLAGGNTQRQEDGGLSDAVHIQYRRDYPLWGYRLLPG